MIVSHTFLTRGWYTTLFVSLLIMTNGKLRRRSQSTPRSYAVITDNEEQYLVTFTNFHEHRRKNEKSHFENGGKLVLVILEHLRVP